MWGRTPKRREICIGIPLIICQNNNLNLCKMKLHEAGQRRKAGSYELNES